MKKLTLESSAGDTFECVAKNAKEKASRYEIVEFEFNDVICLVNKDTNIEWLFRDYCNSWIMGWETVGPDCVEKYSPELQKEFDEKTAIREEERKKQQAEWDRKDKEEREAFEIKVAGIELEILPGKENEYAEYVANNSKDGYSRAVIDYAEGWGKIMQIEIAKGTKVKDIAEASQKGLGFLGITGFQYGCAVNTLSHFWEHGEELRLWHNKQYGVSEDNKGVVNPAILTIS